MIKLSLFTSILQTKRTHLMRLRRCALGFGLFFQHGHSPNFITEITKLQSDNTQTSDFHRSSQDLLKKVSTHTTQPPQTTPAHCNNSVSAPSFRYSWTSSPCKPYRSGSPGSPTNVCKGAHRDSPEITLPPETCQRRGTHR